MYNCHYVIFTNEVEGEDQDKVASLLGCDVVVNEFELQSRYHFEFSC